MLLVTLSALAVLFFALRGRNRYYTLLFAMVYQYFMDESD